MALKFFQRKLAISVAYDTWFINEGRTTAESFNRSPKPEINFVFADRYGKKPTVCQFASPLSDDIHTKPEVKGNKSSNGQSTAANQFLSLSKTDSTMVQVHENSTSMEMIARSVK